MTRKQISFYIFVIYIALIMPGPSVFLCIGDAGHFSLINPQSGLCCPEKDQPTIPETVSTIPESQSTCSCWDIPITLELEADWISTKIFDPIGKLGHLHNYFFSAFHATHSNTFQLLLQENIVSKLFLQQTLQTIVLLN